MGETTCTYQVDVDNAQHLTIAQFLIGAETILSADSFLKYIIRQIEAIKFAYDWRIRSGCPGIKKFKSDFVQKSFQNISAHQSLRQYGNAEEEATYKKAFHDFKIRHGKTITARNYLLRLYEQVFVLCLFFTTIHPNYFRL